jgi:uncharacterized protein
VKQIYDRRIPIRFIFCGIGQSLDAITGGHLSASRPILPVALEPMSHDARWAIINTAAEKLGFMVDREFVIRIGQISDGFPYYVHLIGSVLSWAIFDHRQMTLNATDADFKLAVNGAIEKAESPLRTAYNNAMQKTKGSRDYEDAMWALADGAHLSRQLREVYDRSYCRIMSEQKREPLPIGKFRNRILQSGSWPNY